jgi:hypothetical protein
VTLVLNSHKQLNICRAASRFVFTQESNVAASGFDLQIVLNTVRKIAFYAIVPHLFHQAVDIGFKAWTLGIEFA